MAAPTQEQTIALGPPTTPFGRSSNKTIAMLQVGAEDIFYTDHMGVYNATNNNYPDDIVRISTLELEYVKDPSNEIFEKKYLWVISETGIIIIPERIPNLLRTPKKWVCHTNLTGATEALQGGELYFCENGNLYINNKSDRYGCREGSPNYIVQKGAVLEYFSSIYINTNTYYLYDGQV
jgi:hypothetical protein